METFSFSLLIYLFLATLGLRCYAQTFSSCVSGGYTLAAVCGLLIAVASLVAEQGLCSCSTKWKSFFFFFNFLTHWEVVCSRIEYLRVKQLRTGDTNAISGFVKTSYIIQMTKPSIPAASRCLKLKYYFKYC